MRGNRQNAYKKHKHPINSISTVTYLIVAHVKYPFECDTIESKGSSPILKQPVLRGHVQIYQFQLAVTTPAAAILCFQATAGSSYSLRQLECTTRQQPAVLDSTGRLLPNPLHEVSNSFSRILLTSTDPNPDQPVCHQHSMNQHFLCRIPLLF